MPNYVMKVRGEELNKEKLWKASLIIESILAILYLIADVVTHHLTKAAVLKSRLLMILLVISTVLLVFYKKYQKNAVIRWFLILVVPTLIQFAWAGWFQLALKYLPSLKLVSATIFYLLYLVILLPSIKLLASQVKATIPRLFIVFWFVMILFDNLSLWTLKTGNKIFNQVNTSGLLSALAVFLLGCFLLYSWGFRLNPNLKFEKSKNFSYLVFFFLILCAVVYIVWNDFGSAGTGLFGAFFVFEVDPMKFTFLGFGQAAEAGILEETMRFLNIFILLYAFRNKPKLQVPLSIFISAFLFGSMHLSNWGWQKLAPTLSQVASAFGIGLFLVILYLYSGKIWLSMLVHFLIDYLIFAQTGGSSQPGGWTGDIVDWATTIATIVVPLVLYIWMMFGKRRKVLDENANRLISRENNLAVNE